MSQVMISNYTAGTVLTQGTFQPGTIHTGGFDVATYEGNLLVTVHAYPTGTGTVSFTLQMSESAGSAAANWETVPTYAMVYPLSAGTALAGGTCAFNPVVVGGSIFQQIELVHEYLERYIRVLPVIAQGTFAISSLAFGLEKYA